MAWLEKSCHNVTKSQSLSGLGAFVSSWLMAPAGRSQQYTEGGSEIQCRKNVRRNFLTIESPCHIFTRVPADPGSAVRAVRLKQHFLSINPLIGLRVLTALVLILICIHTVNAQLITRPSPKREVRAVWLTTAAGLDWPHSTDKNEQQASLRKIVVDLKAANFNTIFFQVRSRGDAYYKSAYEPWAENLTGTLGKDPGWDPLAFLLREAHQRGIEVHAWFNVYKVKGPNALKASSPAQPALAFPHSVKEYDGESWFDPGSPDVRPYLLRVTLDLIKNYDIDGVNFDFMRYPGRDFPDDETYRKYGGGQSRDEWRRENINRFVGEFYSKATAIKPMLKIGAAPLGVYQDVRNGNPVGSFFSFYQDSYGWLRRGKMDYLSPQVYWTIRPSNHDPLFAQVVRQWQDLTAGRHIYVGIAAYRPEVSRDIPAYIDTSRASDLDGQAYFRYENVERNPWLSSRYRLPANIPPMTWKDSIPPNTPKNLVVTELSPNIYHLEWTRPTPARDGDKARYYNVYRSTSPNIAFDDPSSIVSITATDSTFLIDTVKTPASMTYYYAVTAFDKGNNESVPSNVGSVIVREMLALGRKLSSVTSLSTSIANNEGAPTLVAYKLADRLFVSLDVFQQRADSVEHLVSTLRKGYQDEGTYVVSLGGTPLNTGRYLIRLKAGQTTLEQPLQVGR